MALLNFSQCVGQPSKIPIDGGTEEQRTLDIVCTVTPAGATVDRQVSISGNATFEKPILGSTLPLERVVVPANGELKQAVTLKSSGPGPFATILVVLTEVAASPGDLVAPPQQHSVLVTLRT
jgi:hypothetical protein